MKEEYKTIEIPSERFFKLELGDKDLERDNSIFEQLAKDMAKAQDIDFAKTPVVDLFTGYMNCQKYRHYMEVLQERIDKAISLLKEAGCYDEETKIFCDDVWEELPNLLNILQGEEK